MLVTGRSFIRLVQVAPVTQRIVGLGFFPFWIPLRPRKFVRLFLAYFIKKQLVPGLPGPFVDILIAE